jgi:NAD(P)-dependent dehydrogenase (short-subunit alcohol dehydrogenase family)
VRGKRRTFASASPAPARIVSVTPRADSPIKDLAAKQGSDEVKIEAEFFKTMRPSALIRRLAEPEEVANMVVYLCGEPASATTGAALRVDGGVVRSIG